MKTSSKYVFFILLSLLVSCGGQTSTSTSSSSGSGSSSETSSSEDSSSTVDDLLNDPNADGTFTSGTNENRYPDDDLYDLVQEKKRILDVGETYVEDFEKPALETKIFPYKADNNATYTLTSSGNASIHGTSLYLVSQGDYHGLYFNGMKFARNSTYQLTFQYKIIVASNDFFLQFRSITGGVTSDIYTTINGTPGDVLTHTTVFNLGDFSDYELSLFPRNDRGSIAIDDLSITRMNSKPRIASASIEGVLATGNILSFSYEYEDGENDPMLSVDHAWFVALDKNGLNKTMIEETSNQLLVLSNYVGKFVGVSLTPRSVGEGEQTLGNRVDVFGATRINGVTPDTGNPIFLDFNQSFVEDFENDTDVPGNLYFSEATQGSQSYITQKSEHVISGSQALYFSSKGNHNAIQFSGINFASRGIYTLSFNYQFLTKGTEFYVQLRSPSSDYSHDKYVGIDLSSTTLGTVYTFTNTFSLDGFSDYALMMFPSIVGCTVIIDDLNVTRLEGYNVSVENKELAVGEYILEDFNSPSAPKLGFDFAQVPTSKITSDSDKIIDTRSLYFESAGTYKCLFMNQGITFTANATYEISFKYKILQFQDTLYLQLNAGGATLFDQFGAPEEANQICEYSGEFTITSATNYLVQIFPGAANQTTRVIFDDIKIMRKG